VPRRIDGAGGSHLNPVGSEGLGNNQLAGTAQVVLKFDMGDGRTFRRTSRSTTAISHIRATHQCHDSPVTLYPLCLISAAVRRRVSAIDPALGFIGYLGEPGPAELNLQEFDDAKPLPDNPIPRAPSSQRHRCLASASPTNTRTALLPDTNLTPGIMPFLTGGRHNPPHPEMTPPSLSAD